MEDEASKAVASWIKSVVEKKHKTKTCSADHFFLMSAYTFVNMIFQPVTKFDRYNMLIYNSFILFIVRLLSFEGKSSQ